MAQDGEEILRFGDFQIETGAFQLLKRGKPVALERRVYDFVLYLIRQRHRVVSQEELLENVWQQGTLSDSAVARCVSAARKAFEDPDCIQNLYGRGYRWTRPVEVVSGARTATVRLDAIRVASKGIFGRERELDLAGALIERAALGEGKVCLVSGEPGIGKTRLLRALRDLCGAHRMQVVIGRCRETEGTPPYWPWSQALRQLYDDESRPAPDSVRWAISSGPGMLEDRALEPRVLVWEAFADSIVEEARRTPIAILFDDLHHIDTGSACLLEVVAERAADAPLFLAAAYRHVEMDRDPVLSASVARTVRVASPLCLELKGLGLDETRDLLSIQSGLVPSGDVLRCAHELTGGNPFFLHQVAPLLSARQVALDAKSIVRSLPSTVRASIESQVATVSPEGRGLLDMAAVLGRVSRVDVLANALDLGTHEVLRLVHEAGRAGLVTERDGEPQSFAFVHDLIREIIYEGLVLTQRGRLHLSAAHALERSEQDAERRLDEIAHHYVRAAHSGGGEQAIDYSARAGSEAAGRYAYETAREHLTNAVALFEAGLGDQRRLCDILVDLGAAELNSGNEGGAWVAFERAASLARAIGDTGALLRIALILTSSVHVSRFEFDPRLARLTEELLEATGRTNPGLRALLLARLIFIFAWSPGHASRAALGHEACELIKEVDDSRVRASVVVARCVASEYPGDLSERLRLSEEGVRLCAVTQDHQWAQFAHVMRILACLEAGRLDCVREHAKACRELIHRLRLRHASALAVPLTHAGLLAHIDGRLDVLEDFLNELNALATATGDVGALSVHDVQHVMLLLERARAADAVPVAEKWVAMVPGMPGWRCFLTLVLARAGSHEEARVHLRSFAENRLPFEPDWQWLASMTLLAGACAELNERDTAPLLYDRLAPFRDRFVAIGAACLFTGSVERYLGLLAGVQGRFALANEHFDRANEAHAKIGARLMLAHSLCDQALLLERATDLNQSGRAAELRRDATALADELGLVYVKKRLGVSGS